MQILQRTMLYVFEETRLPNCRMYGLVTCILTAIGWYFWEVNPAKNARPMQHLGESQNPQKMWLLGFPSTNLRFIHIPSTWRALCAPQSLMTGRSKTNSNIPVDSANAFLSALEPKPSQHKFESTGLKSAWIYRAFWNLLSWFSIAEPRSCGIGFEPRNRQPT